MAVGSVGCGAAPLAAQATDRAGPHFATGVGAQRNMEFLLLKSPTRYATSIPCL